MRVAIILSLVSVIAVCLVVAKVCVPSSGFNILFLMTLPVEHVQRPSKSRETYSLKIR